MLVTRNLVYCRQLILLPKRKMFLRKKRWKNLPGNIKMDFQKKRKI